MSKEKVTQALESLMKAKNNELSDVNRDIDEASNRYLQLVLRRAADPNDKKASVSDLMSRHRKAIKIYRQERKKLQASLDKLELLKERIHSDSDFLESIIAELHKLDADE